MINIAIKFKHCSTISVELCRHNSIGCLTALVTGALSRDLSVGVRNNYIFGNHWPWLAYSLYSFHVPSMTVKGRLHPSNYFCLSNSHISTPISSIHWVPPSPNLGLYRANTPINTFLYFRYPFKLRNNSVLCFVSSIELMWHVICITWPVGAGSKRNIYSESLILICLFALQLLCGFDDD